MKAINLKFLFPILISLSCSQVFAQYPKDDFVSRIENLRKENKLTVKIYPEETYVGLLAGYYDDGRLVLINSLSGGELGSRELLYYIKDGALHSTFMVDVSFEPSDEWAPYYAKHKAAYKCTSCHGNKRCNTISIVFKNKPQLVQTIRFSAPVTLMGKINCPNKKISLRLRN